MGTFPAEERAALETTSRYLFLRTDQGPTDDEELRPPADFLDEVGLSIENAASSARLSG